MSSALLVNSAGGSAADPVLKDLGLQLVFIPESMDVATADDAAIDTDSTTTYTNSVKASLSPAATVIEKGTNAAWDGDTDILTIGSTTGLAAGDKIYLSHASLTDGIYEILTVEDGTTLTLTSDLGTTITTISYQVAWRYDSDTGTSPYSSDGSGVENWVKFKASDGATNQTDKYQDYFVFVRDQASDVVVLDGGSYTGQETKNSNITLAICSAWTNNGGVATVDLEVHGTEAVCNAYWNVGLDDQDEKVLATAESTGLYLSAGDGIKYFRLVLRALAESADSAYVDCDITLDSTGPTLSISVEAR